MKMISQCFSLPWPAIPVNTCLTWFSWPPSRAGGTAAPGLPRLETNCVGADEIRGINTATPRSSPGTPGLALAAAGLEPAEGGVALQPSGVVRDPRVILGSLEYPRAVAGAILRGVARLPAVVATPLEAV
jgi:hypothetical protein